MREELNGLPQRERSRREYQRVMDAYRRVYYSAPTSSKADASVVAVAELLAESGRSFNDKKALRAAIAQYEFLRREYPGSKYRFDALFTIGQIYKDDLEENDKARESFPGGHSPLPASATCRRRARGPRRDGSAGAQQAEALATAELKAQEANPQDVKPQDAKSSESRPTRRATLCRWSPESVTGPPLTTPASPSILSRK